MGDFYALCEVSRNEDFRALGLTRFSANGHHLCMAGTSYTLHVHLRAWRKHRGLTLEQVEQRIGSKKNTISGWETGKRKVDLDDLAKLAEVYGVEPAALLFAPAGSPEFDALRETAAIVKKMKPTRLKTWLETGRALVEED